MSRLPDRAIRRLVPILLMGIAASLLLCCSDLDGRGKNREGNRKYRETRFVDAAALYEGALKKVQDDRIEYNLGLAYSKIFKPGLEEPVLLAEKSDAICDSIPNVKYIRRSVCVKNDPEEEDRGYNKCDAKAICPSSATCKDIELCTKENKDLANLSAEHMLKWIEKQPSDEEIKAGLVKLNAKLADLEKEADAYTNDIVAAQNKEDKLAEDEATQKKTHLDEVMKALKGDIEEMALKFTMRKLITQEWLDSQQFDRALAFWQDQLKAKPNDPEVMGNIAGINLKAGDWRKSIEWYKKVAEVSSDNTGKVTAYSFIGNVAWSKLNSKTLVPDEAIELADLGIGALQKAAELAPKNVSFLRLQASLFGFRALVHGASWAAAIDRASSEDLKAQVGVLSPKPPKPPGTPTPAPPTPPASPSMSGGPAEKSGG
jgi:tetratricopeptide (TPR) repeat protein